MWQVDRHKRVPGLLPRVSAQPPALLPQRAPVLLEKPRQKARDAETFRGLRSGESASCVERVMMACEERNQLPGRTGVGGTQCAIAHGGEGVEVDLEGEQEWQNPVHTCLPGQPVWWVRKSRGPGFVRRGIMIYNLTAFGTQASWVPCCRTFFPCLPPPSVLPHVLAPSRAAEGKATRTIKKQILSKIRPHDRDEVTRVSVRTDTKDTTATLLAAAVTFFLFIVSLLHKNTAVQHTATH